MIDHIVRFVLRLLEQLDHDPPAIQLLLRGDVKVGAQLREGFKVTKGRQVQPQRAGDLFHGLDLSVAAHARHADADVDRRPHAREEQIRLQIDLPVRNRNHVRRNIGSHFAFLRLDDRQRGNRAARSGFDADFVLILIRHGRQIVLSLLESRHTDVCFAIHAVAGGLGRVSPANESLLSQLTCSFEQAAVQVKHIAGVGFAARRATQQQ